MSLKFLVVLVLLALVGAFVYWRMRPYLLVARRVLGVVRDARRMSVRIETPGAAMPPRPAGRKKMVEKLARCAVCNVWFPASRSTAPNGSLAYYCSASCLEQARKQPHQR